MVAAREFPAVFSACLAALPHIDPSIRLRRRQGIQPEVPDLLPVSVICMHRRSLSTTS